MSEEVKKLNELKSARVATNLGFDASGNLVRETVENENYAEHNLGNGTHWIRVLKMTEKNCGCIVFLSTGYWCGKPRVVTLAINHDWTESNSNQFILRVLGGLSDDIEGVRFVKEGTEKYLEFHVWTARIFAKAFGIGLEIVPSLPVSSPAADAEITELAIIRETTT